MTDDSFKEIKGLEGVDTSKTPPSNNIMSSSPKSHNEFLENYHKSIDSFIEHRKKEAEENLRRYDKQIEASMNSRASAFIGSIGDKDSSVSVINLVFNYKKASLILEAIKGKFNDPSFNSEFGDDAELVKQLINKAFKQLNEKDDPTLIRKSLAAVSDIAIRVSPGVIASGIIVLLGRLSS